MNEPTQEQGRRRRVLVVYILAALGTSLLAPFALGFLRHGSPFEYFQRRAFDKGAWRASGDDGDDRLLMIDDLVDGILRVGMARQETQALLGPPSETSKFREWDLVYRLGMERSLTGVDSEWLVIRFGAEDTVTEFRVVRD